MPETAIRNLTKVRADHGAAVLVISYGNRAYDDTLLELRKAMEDCGFCVVAVVAAVAEHSIMHQYAAGRPDEQDITELHDFSGKILEKLNSHDKRIPGGHLGLFNVDSIIRLHYGPRYGLSARVMPGEGSRVRLRLPVKREEGSYAESPGG